MSNIARRVDGLRAAWDEPSTRWLHVTALGFSTAEYAVLIAIAVVAYDVGGAAAVGLATAVRTIPAVVAGPALAVGIDHFDRSTVLRIALVARAATLMALVVLLLDGAPHWILLCVVGAEAISASALFPAVGALIPELSTSPESLASSTSMASATESLGTLVGPVLAAVILAVDGPVAVFGAAAALVAGAAVSTLGVRSPRRLPTPADRRTVRSRFVDGLDAIARDRATRTVVSGWSVETVAVGMSEVFVVVIAIDLLDWGDPGVGYLNAALGVGGLAGSLWMLGSRRTVRFGRLLAASIVAFGVGIGLSGGAPIGVIVVVAHILIGHAGAVADVSAQTVLQRSVDDAVLARVLGTFEGVYWATRGLGAILASAVVVALGERAGLVAVGLAVAIAGVLVGRPLQRTDRALRPPSGSVDLLRGNEVFASMSIPTLERLARSANEFRAAEGSEIVTQGTTDGAELYVLAAGRVTVEVDGTPLTTLGPGQLFGEIAPLRGSPRTATVRAATDVDGVVIDGQDFADAVAGRVTSEGHAMALTADRLAEIGRMRSGRGR